MNTLKQKLLRREIALGTHIQLNENTATEIIGSLGFDYLWIDTEHTSLSLQNVADHLLAARLAGVSTLVRIPWNDPVRMKPILEMGPDGIIIPMVNSYEEALAVVRGSMYPPKGTRGFGPLQASRYGLMPLDEYYRHAQEDMLRIVQVEHVDAVRDLKRIVTIEDIDAYIIGPMDLSSSVNKMGQLEDPEVCALIDEAVRIVHEAGKPIGVSMGMLTREQLQTWKDRGIDMISLGNEISLLITGCQNLLEHMKSVML